MKVSPEKYLRPKDIDRKIKEYHKKEEEKKMKEEEFWEKFDAQCEKIYKKLDSITVNLEGQKTQLEILIEQAKQWKEIDVAIKETELHQAKVSKTKQKIVDRILEGIEVTFETAKAYKVKRKEDGKIAWIAKSNIEIMSEYDDGCTITFLPGKAWAAKKINWEEDEYPSN